jgi:hypothetical protein
MTTGRALATAAGVVWTLVGVVGIVGSREFRLGLYQLFGVDLGAGLLFLVGLCVGIGICAWIVAAAVGTIRDFRRSGSL